MSGVGGGGHKQQLQQQPSKSTMNSGSSSSLLLSPPSSRSFPFRDGSAYLESALLVPYDINDEGNSAAPSPSLEGIKHPTPSTTPLMQPVSTTFGYQQHHHQQNQQFPASNYINFGPSTFPESTAPTSNPPHSFHGSVDGQFAPSPHLPPPPMQQPLMTPYSEGLVRPSFNVFNQSLPPPPSTQHSFPPSEDNQNAPIPPPPTSSISYFNPYSSSSPVSSVDLSFAPAITSEISSANPYARSGTVGQSTWQMTTTGQSAPPTSMFPRPPPDAVVSNQWPPQAHPPPMTVQEPAPIPYVPVQSHWFYCKDVEKKPVWFPFSLLDSVHLEEVYNKVDHQDGQSMIVATDGGRYDVYVQDRIRCAIYWDEEPMAVRRASWFYRLDGDRAFLPYEEHFSEKLEEEYSVAVTTNTWHRRLEFPEGETVVIHNPQVIVHYKPARTVDWESATESQMKPRVVRRGMDDAEIVDDGEAMQIDHLVFVVHGIGAICDLKFRTLPEAVGDFRMIANGLLSSHFRNHVESGRIGRVEFLPVSWHNFLHGDATGIDEKLKPITLKSIPKLRYFANDTILDVLFYTSPVYCQAIVNQVSSEINRIHRLFLQRNLSFSGKVSLAGHSLGSVILFDLLCHQPPLTSFREKSIDSRSSMELRSPTPSSSSDQFQATTRADPDAVEVGKRPLSLEEALQQLGLEEYMDVFNKESMDMDTLRLCGEDDLKDIGIPLGPRKKFLALMRELQEESAKQGCDDTSSQLDTASYSRRRRKPSETMIHYVVGMAGTGHPSVIYPRLDFQTTCFFAIGSPVAMFLTIRGQDTVWDSFKLPNCPAYYNIFHPFDPVAYRMEPLIDPSFTTRPVLVPHHKGRKRMHLEIKESLSRVGADLRQKVVESLRTTWNTINDFARAHRASGVQVEAEDDKVLEDELSRQSRKSSQVDDDLNISSQDQREEDLIVGQLNGGRRIDYVLQEKPIESFNEYLFALQSHTCYWESEDTVLLMLKEIYSSYGIHPSFQVHDPQMKQPQPLGYRRASSAGAAAWPSASKSDYQISAAQRFDASTLTPQDRVVGIDPTAPPESSFGQTSTAMASAAAPPPLSGFVKQSALRK